MCCFEYLNSVSIKKFEMKSSFFKKNKKIKFDRPRRFSILCVWLGWTSTDAEKESYLFLWLNSEHACVRATEPKENAITQTRPCCAWANHELAVVSHSNGLIWTTTVSVHQSQFIVWPSIKSQANAYGELFNPLSCACANNSVLCTADPPLCAALPCLVVGSSFEWELGWQCNSIGNNVLVAVRASTSNKAERVSNLKRKPSKQRQANYSTREVHAACTSMATNRSIAHRLRAASTSSSWLLPAHVRYTCSVTQYCTY
jgi:hypothetical protein